MVEDNAQAHGATWHGQPTGSFGQVNATSFYPSKNLGNGAAVTTKDAALARQVQLLRNYGSVQRYHNKMSGYNSRLDELQATVLQVRLRYLPQWTQQRRQLAAWYTEYLTGILSLRLPAVAAGAAPV